jgi:Flp pilus assembly protein TadD
MKADDLVDSARAAVDQRQLPVAIALLKRATEVDPKNKFAWNNLGLIYLADARERSGHRRLPEAD